MLTVSKFMEGKDHSFNTLCTLPGIQRQAFNKGCLTQFCREGNVFLESPYCYFIPWACLFILHTLLHNISLFVLFSLGIRFWRSAWMCLETTASHGCRQLHGVQPPPLTCLLPSCLQQRPPVRGLQILLFALLPTLRHRLGRDYRTLFSEEKAQGNCAPLPCPGQILR